MSTDIPCKDCHLKACRSPAQNACFGHWQIHFPLFSYAAFQIHFPSGIYNYKKLPSCCKSLPYKQHSPTIFPFLSLHTVPHNFPGAQTQIRCPDTGGFLLALRLCSPLWQIACKTFPHFFQPFPDIFPQKNPTVRLSDNLHR